jgi:23S rRNA (cytosine1962-C5)-methyltransferase
MFSHDQYQLLDFGDGRKLERFGAYVLDRPNPAVDGVPQSTPALWKSAHARYRRTCRDRGQWSVTASLPKTWTITHAAGTFEMKLNEFGHVGLFPEHTESWQWIGLQAKRAKRPLKILNLFAHTGGATLAAASAGAEVVHVDAAEGVVAWARRNAALSGLADAAIRWIVEDAAKFARRELRRGNRYDAVILDPPSYGHGPKGEVWKLAEHLLPLLHDCGKLTAERRAFMLLSCHSPGYGPAELQASLADAVFGHCQSDATAARMNITASDGRKLPCGAVARWAKPPETA